MLPLGRPSRLIAMVAITAHLLLPGCTDSSPVHAELASAVADGREALGLHVRVARFCGPTAEASVMAGGCQLDEVEGPAGASFYERDHVIAFRYTAEDGQTDLEYRSEGDSGVRETTLAGRVTLGGKLRRVNATSIIVARAGEDYQEVEIATRLRLEGDDRRVELEEVFYRIREGDHESFYRTYWDSWETKAGAFVLDDGIFEGARAGDGRWRMHAEGVVSRDGEPFAHVEIGGPTDARRAIIALPDGDLEL
jgi:hypothetical protein